ncbi:MAG: c-type cytochrome biogenesis protein CcmI [Hyphomonadaceae bacterium]
MMLWLTLTVLLAGGVAFSCWPLIGRSRLANGASSDIYRAQLLEVDREESTGLISPEDGRMARTEVQRRLIASTSGDGAPGENDMTSSDRTAFIAIAAFVALGSGIVYTVVGSPGVPASPAPVNSARIDAAGDQAVASANVGSVEEMISKLEARLEADPSDVEGWRMLGWSRFRTDDYAGAAEAYARAVKLTPGDAETQSAFGEALSRAAGGMVTPDALAALQEAVEANPTDARARFLLGLKKQQDGKPAEALNDWIAMLRTAESDAPWYGEVRGRVLELSASSGIDVASKLPPARSTSPPTPQAAAGPTSVDVSAASAMSPQDRQAMIDGMVSRLDAKLKANPKDLDGWLKLIRARRVLAQDDLAARALADGQAAFAGDAASLAKLKDAMTESLALPPT